MTKVETLNKLGRALGLLDLSLDESNEDRAIDLLVDAVSELETLWAGLGGHVDQEWSRR